jgi:hypothetical protein
MAISLGNHLTLTPQANQSSPYTETFDLADTTKAIVVNITIYDTSATDGVVSGITYGGDAMTNSSIVYEADCDGHLSTWYLNSPSVSSTVIDVAFGGIVTDLMGSITEITGGFVAEDSTPATSSSGNGSPSISWSTVAADTVVFGCTLTDQSAGNKITCDSTGSIYIQDVGGDTVAAAVVVASSAGSHSVSWSDSDNDEDWVAYGAAYKEGLAQVNDDLEAQWANLVNDDLEAQYDMFNLVNDDIEAQWDIANLVNDDLEAQWDIANVVNDDLDAQYDILNLVNDDLEVIYDIAAGAVAAVTTISAALKRKIRLGF